MRSIALISIIIGFTAVGCQPMEPPALSVFKTDGCSCFPDGTSGIPGLWERDCEVHDLAYWKGGTCGERKAADLLFRDGIREKGHPLIAELAYAGVRMGGSPWLPTPWRWGFGWSEFPRGYGELSEEEKSLVGKGGSQGAVAGYE